MLALLEDTEDNIRGYWIDLPLDVSGWNFVIFETENQGPPHPNVEILGAFPKRYPSYEFLWDLKCVYHCWTVKSTHLESSLVCPFSSFNWCGPWAHPWKKKWDCLKSCQQREDHDFQANRPVAHLEVRPKSKSSGLCIDLFEHVNYIIMIIYDMYRSWYQYIYMYAICLQIYIYI